MEEEQVQFNLYFMAYNEYTTIKNFINGDWVRDSMDGELINYDPSTGTAYSDLPNSTQDTIDLSVEVANNAFPCWKKTSVQDRSNLLWKIANLIEKNAHELAIAECIDNGKPLSLCERMDIPRAAANFKFFAQSIINFHEKAFQSSANVFNYTTNQPLGVVATISPWNLPLYLFTWKIAPALATGNTVVAKPSEITPMTAFLLSKIVKEAGLPDGVLNIVQGEGLLTGEALVNHPHIKAVSFTGSTRAGKRIAQVIAPQFKKYSLEMGGKNALIIFDDVDIDQTVDLAIRASFTNQGQICLCTSRILVHQNIYESFKRAFVKKVAALKIGDPLESDTHQGAVVSVQHYEKILKAIQTAQQENGIVLTGGEAFKPEGRCEKGWFVYPTILEGLSMDSSTNQEEIFGPVVSLHAFSDREEAIALANNSHYGLACTILTNNNSHAHAVAQSVDAGIVWVNTWLYRDLRTPFGGMKDSGVGREGGEDAFEFFTEKKNITIQF